MRILLYIFFIVAVILASYGFYIGQEDLAISQLCIGLGVTTLFFIWMPTFVYYRWKGKDVTQYIAQSRKHLENA